MDINLIKKEVGKVVVGQEEMVNALLVGLMTNSHILLEGVPGLAKTTTVNALASVLGLDFKRVQFTPDLLPSDITGAQIYNPKTSEFELKKGPVFTNLLLADEINRAPAKVQSALLEVMQEKQVTLGVESFKIPKPFLVLATQNPVEQEGAYTLPEAQLDRFMMKIKIDYNTKEEELEIMRRVVNMASIELNKVASSKDIGQIQEDIKNVHIDKEVEEYIVDLVFASRYPSKYGLEDIAKYIEYGVSPRASIDLHKASKAQAYLEGKDFVTPVSVLKVLKPIFRHRLILTYEADEIEVDDIIQRIVDAIKIP
ncbi:MAG: MoxR-like ATPase in aerotolerance operon [uncultured Campylobacterales bacterium]|uniref:MoxR-like ATPase in aerotolerance operon n=1 Tax=uncultured Campylobacterales bacterium TaxID=352960 RepID=A0A6S6SB69_9BACT|nr:MAG: MoxR-like ATPase in aerotolerance operon [uncultured Campylobacterales bacterium]